MPQYSYMAIDPKGQNVSGSLPAQDRTSALDQIARKGLVPVRVDEQAVAAPKAVSRADAGSSLGTIAKEILPSASTTCQVMAVGIPSPLLPVPSARSESKGDFLSSVA